MHGYLSFSVLQLTQYISLFWNIKLHFYLYVETFIYRLCQKKCTFNSDFFLWPPWGRGAKNSHGRLCKWEFYTCSISFVKNLQLFFISYFAKRAIHGVNYQNTPPPGPQRKFGIKCAFLLTQTYGQSQWVLVEDAPSFHNVKSILISFMFYLICCRVRRSHTHWTH